MARGTQELNYGNSHHSKFREGLVVTGPTSFTSNTSGFHLDPYWQLDTLQGLYCIAYTRE